MQWRTEGLWRSGYVDLFLPHHLWMDDPFCSCSCRPACAVSPCLPSRKILTTPLRKSPVIKLDQVAVSLKHEHVSKQDAATQKKSLVREPCAALAHPYKILRWNVYANAL